MRGFTLPYSLPYAASAGRGVWSMFYRLGMFFDRAWGRAGGRELAWALGRGGLALST